MQVLNTTAAIIITPAIAAAAKDLIPYYQKLLMRQTPDNIKIISNFINIKQQTSVIKEAFVILRLIRRHVEEERSHKNCCCRRIMRCLEVDQTPSCCERVT
jgi:hypothetical protein